MRMEDAVEILYGNRKERHDKAYIRKLEHIILVEDVPYERCQGCREIFHLEELARGPAQIGYELLLCEKCKESVLILNDVVEEKHENSDKEPK